MWYEVYLIVCLHVSVILFVFNTAKSRNYVFRQWKEIEKRMKKRGEHVKLYTDSNPSSGLKSRIRELYESHFIHYTTLLCAFKN